MGRVNQVRDGYLEPFHGIEGKTGPVKIISAYKLPFNEK